MVKGRRLILEVVNSWISMCPVQFRVSQPVNFAASTVM
jgi:hypothetical protein